MLRIGLTGGIASGKSAAAECFRSFGAEIIDADVLARSVVAPGLPAYEEIVARFGARVVAPDGSLDRAALGAIVFSDDAARADLNAIVHPWVRATARAIEAAIEDPYAIVVHVIPLLVETGQARDFDAVVVVDVDPDVQLARLMARNGLDAAQAQARIDAQASRAERLSVATWVIRNDADLAALEERCAAVWHQLEHLRADPNQGCGC